MWERAKPDDSTCVDTATSAAMVTVDTQLHRLAMNHASLYQPCTWDAAAILDEDGDDDNNG